MSQLVPVGSTLTRVYYAVRTNPYAQGEEFADWDAAVTVVKSLYAERLASLKDSLGGWATQEEIAATAKSGVYLETRWTMEHPDGGSTDFMSERHADVTVLRTRASFTA